MSTVETFLPSYAFNRDRTLGMLEADRAASQSRGCGSRGVPAWPAPFGWQLMHIGITEEIFATERLAPEKPKAFADLWPRFRGGSTPDDDAPRSS